MSHGKDIDLLLDLDGVIIEQAEGRKTYDHRHRHSKDEGIPYEFVDAYQLIKDFWSEVDKTLKMLGLEEE